MMGRERNTWTTPRDSLAIHLNDHQNQLSGIARDVWVSDGMTNHVAYVVWSYHTPIAWFISEHNGGEENTWVVVMDKFSGATSRHQGIVWEAMRMITRVCVVSSKGFMSDWVPMRYGDNDDG